MITHESYDKPNLFKHPLRCSLATNSSFPYKVYVRDFMTETTYMSDIDGESTDCLEDYVRFLKLKIGSEFKRHIDITQRFCPYEHLPTGKN